MCLRSERGQAIFSVVRRKHAHYPSLNPTEHTGTYIGLSDFSKTTRSLSKFQDSTQNPWEIENKNMNMSALSTRLPNQELYITQAVSEHRRPFGWVGCHLGLLILLSAQKLLYRPSQFNIFISPNITRTFISTSFFTLYLFGILC